MPSYAAPPDDILPASAASAASAAAWRCRIVVALSICAVSSAANAAEPLTGLELAEAEQAAFRRATLTAAPSVVRIETVGGLDKLGDVLLNTGATTGTVVEPGLVVSSAFNFAGEPSAIFVTTDDGRRGAAEKVATDEVRQLVLLRAADATEQPPIAAADADRLRVGQWTLALGRTFGNGPPNVSVGLLSARSRLWGLAMQTDAKVSPANYGGPLVDLAGRAIGVLVPLSPQERGQTAGIEWYDSGIGFAIPMADVRESVRRLKSGEDARLGRLGVAIAGTGLVGEPAVIERLHPLGPADKAGLKAGDRIVSIDGLPIENAGAFKRQVLGRYEGDALEIAVARSVEGDDEPQTVSVSVELVAELPTYEFPQLGVLLDAAAAVRSTLPESPAAGLFEAGDRLSRIGDEAVDTAAAAIATLARYQVGETVPVVFERGDEERRELVTLATLATELPDTLAAPLGEAAGDVEGRGRQTGEIEGSELTFKAYYPQLASESLRCGVLVWLGQSDPITDYRAECETRNVALVVPSPDAGAGGFSPQDIDDLNRLLATVSEAVPVDASRIAVFAEGSSAPAAIQWATRPESVVSGLVLETPKLRQKPPGTTNAKRILWAMPPGDDRTATALRQFLREAKHPLTELPAKAPPEAVLRWVDWMGRL